MEKRTGIPETTINTEFLAPVLEYERVIKRMKEIGMDPEKDMRDPSVQEEFGEFYRELKVIMSAKESVPAGIRKAILEQAIVNHGDYMAILEQYTE